MSQIFDIAALRIIVNSVEKCYQTLGIMHSIYQPIPGRIFDYIARPKPSGYQSLHTTVQDSESNIFEIQIRTAKMHEIAEYGSAAHWKYKDEQNNLSSKSQNEWLEELQKLKEIKDKKEFIATIKDEMFSKQIFTFTPRGDIINLPSGSTPLDFAYRVHTNVGNHFSGVKINGRIMPAKTELKTGDVIEILTSLKVLPSKNWLEITKTGNAKSKIKNALRKINYNILLPEGEKILGELVKKYDLNINRADIERNLSKSKLPYKTLPDALVSLAEGNLNKIKLLKTIFPHFSPAKQKKKAVLVVKKDQLVSLKGILHTFALCCKPTTESKNIGYLSGKHIIRVHRKSCKRLKNLDPKRLLEL